MEWLRIQLQLLRERGMKAILTGHVPPARVDSKVSWDETCWQKYTLWMRQYRDVVLTSIYGHMNMEHFMLQDFHDIEKHFRKGIDVVSATAYRGKSDVSAASTADYLVGLRNMFAKIPAVSEKSPLVENEEEESNSWLQFFQSTLSGGRTSSYRKKVTSYTRSKTTPLSKIGGEFGERYSLSIVGASLVPNYLPTLRVFEYNITGLEESTIPESRSNIVAPQSKSLPLDVSPDVEFSEYLEDLEDILTRKKKEREARHKKPKQHKFKVPYPPTKSSPPGPGYSPQTLSLVGYTQYYANLTHINNDFVILSGEELGEERWKPGHHGGNVKHGTPKPKEFKFKIEYDTFSDKIFGLKDLTVRSYINLAKQIAAPKSGGKSSISGDEDLTELDANIIEDNEEYSDETDVDAEKKSKKHKGKKHKKKKKKRHNKVWYAFIRRAFVGTVDPADIEEMFEETSDVVQPSTPESIEDGSLEL
jgi:endopolyphosphatase